MVEIEIKKKTNHGFNSWKVFRSYSITDDNPRNENPDKIIDEIIKGFKSSKYEICHNRKDAINKH